MIRPGLTLIAFIFTLNCLSQNTDSVHTHTYNLFDIKIDSVTGSPVISITPQQGRQEPFIVSRGNILIISRGPTLAFLEEMIVTFESQECDALRTRDQSTLQRLWSRDFTLDKKQPEVVSSSNSLPAYLSYNRIIEKINVIDANTVYTSGYESFQEFKNDLNVRPHTIQKYFHAWTKTNGLWKLTTKRSAR
ncbi:MAG TPA: hypothetical protein VGD40_22215 [Chryseosolibacter sp.]